MTWSRLAALYKAKCKDGSEFFFSACNDEQAWALAEYHSPSPVVALFRQ